MWNLIHNIVISSLVAIGIVSLFREQYDIANAVLIAIAVWLFMIFIVSGIIVLRKGR